MGLGLGLKPKNENGSKYKILFDGETYYNNPPVVFLYDYYNPPDNYNLHIKNNKDINDALFLIETIYKIPNWKKVFVNEDYWGNYIETIAKFKELNVKLVIFIGDIRKETYKDDSYKLYRWTTKDEVYNYIVKNLL